MEPQWITTAQAALLANRTPATIRAWVVGGLIGAKRVGNTLVVLSEDVRRVASCPPKPGPSRGAK